MLVRKLSLPMQLSHLTHRDVGYVIILCKVIGILIIINKHEPHMRLFWLPDTTFISHVSRYSWLRHKIWAIKIVLNFALRLFFFSFPPSGFCIRIFPLWNEYFLFLPFNSLAVWLEPEPFLFIETSSIHDVSWTVSWHHLQTFNKMSLEDFWREFLHYCIHVVFAWAWWCEAYFVSGNVLLMLSALKTLVSEVWCFPRLENIGTQWYFVNTQNTHHGK